VEELSELDIRIIVALSPNARRSNVQIARELGIAEGTVRRRIQRMMDGGILRVVPVLHPRLLGFAVEVRFDLSVELGQIERVGQQLAAMPEVYGVVYCTGARDLSVGALFRSDDELLEFLDHRLPTIPGIQRVTTTHVLRTTKRLRDWWPAIARGAVGTIGQSAGKHPGVTGALEGDGVTPMTARTGDSRAALGRSPRVRTAKSPQKHVRRRADSTARD
jgi:Lrp/AsnC family transcriptional regulator for asnA, asnC and gidA